MMNLHLEEMKVGDLLWMPLYGDESSVWLVTGLDAAQHEAGPYELVQLLDLEDCHVQVVARAALNERMRIL